MKLKAPIIFLLLFLFVAIRPLFAQKANHVIRWNPLAMIVGTISLEYEMVINKKMSLGTGFGYMDFTFGDPTASGEYHYNGYGFNPYLRYYVTHNTKDIPAGFYIGPTIDYTNLTIELTIKDPSNFSNSATGSIDVSTLGVGAFIGYQWIFSDIVALDIYLGGGQYSGSTGKIKIQYSNGTVEEKEYNGSQQLSGFKFLGGLSAGIAF